jgi:hypothetical protein
MMTRESMYTSVDINNALNYASVRLDEYFFTESPHRHKYAEMFGPHKIRPVSVSWESMGVSFVPGSIPNNATKFEFTQEGCMSYDCMPYSNLGAKPPTKVQNKTSLRQLLKNPGGVHVAGDAWHVLDRSGLSKKAGTAGCYALEDVVNGGEYALEEYQHAVWLPDKSQCVVGSSILRNFCLFPTTRDTKDAAPGITDVPPFTYSPNLATCQISREYCEERGVSFDAGILGKTPPTCNESNLETFSTWITSTNFTHWLWSQLRNVDGEAQIKQLIHTRANINLVAGKSGGWLENQDAIDPMETMDKMRMVGLGNLTDEGPEFVKCMEMISSQVAFDILATQARKLSIQLIKLITPNVIKTLARTGVDMARVGLRALVAKNLIFRATFTILPKFFSFAAEALIPGTQAFVFMSILLIIWDISNPSYKKIQYNADILDETASRIAHESNLLFGKYSSLELYQINPSFNPPPGFPSSVNTAAGFTKILLTPHLRYMKMFGEPTNPETNPHSQDMVGKLIEFMGDYLLGLQANSAGEKLQPPRGRGAEFDEEEHITRAETAIAAELEIIRGNLADITVSISDKQLAKHDLDHTRSHFSISSSHYPNVGFWACGIIFFGIPTLCSAYLTGSSFMFAMIIVIVMTLLCLYFGNLESVNTMNIRR